MIQIISKAYKVGDQAYSTLEEAQAVELQTILLPAEGFSAYDLAVFVLQNRAKVLDILTTKANSRPKRRKINKPAKVISPTV